MITVDEFATSCETMVGRCSSTKLRMPSSDLEWNAMPELSTRRWAGSFSHRPSQVQCRMRCQASRSKSSGIPTRPAIQVDARQG